LRWLILKDLRILRRSPLLVALLVIYPIVIALLIGFALSRGPDKPRIAFVNEIPPHARTFEVGNQSLNANQYAPDFFKSVDAVTVHSRAKALQLVREGKVLGAVILPPDITQKLESGTQQARIEVIYNGEDAVKQRYVSSVIKARMADANAALSKKIEQSTAGYINLLRDGGTLHLLGSSARILGLRNARAIVAGAIAALPRDSPLRGPLLQVEQFGTLAIDNLGVSNDVLRSVGTPVAVKQTVVGGSRTPLDVYAAAISVTVSLMFLTLLLASGLLALEREEHAFSRLVRGLVSRLALLVEKIGLAALCACLVTLAMLVALGAFFIDLDWGRFPLWLLVLAVGGIAFGALGVALGAIAREVRAASLFAFLLSLPIAFLALVPNGAVASGLFTVVRVVSAAFPFKATLQGLNGALNAGGPDVVGPLAHLAAIAVAYTLLARLALRRFT
jgi:ABC-2 type transport system permease protein